jgi:hypothetical protein
VYWDEDKMSWKFDNSQKVQDGLSHELPPIAIDTVMENHDLLSQKIPFSKPVPLLSDFY